MIMSYGNPGYRTAPSPFANSIRQQPMQASQVVTPNQGLGALFQRLGISQPNNRITRDVPQENVYGNMVGSLSQDTPDPMPMNLTQGTESFYAVNRPQQPRPAQLQPANPFEGNEQYQALMEYQKSMAPQQEQLDRLNELRTAFEGTGGYKDYRINQMEQQMQRMQQMQRQRNPMMGMGLGGMSPMGMQPYQGFGRPQLPMRQPMPVPRGGYMGQQMMNQPRQFGAMGYNQPQPYQQQQYGMMGGYQQNPYQQMRPQPQQFGGYGMGQQMGGYGGYGGMSNPYQPQQMGSYNPNNSMGYGQQQMNQFQGYMR